MSGSEARLLRVDPAGEPPVIVGRYSLFTRLNHWTLALCFVLLAVSGAALFHPSMFGLTVLFGGGQMTRWLHPVIGCVLMAAWLVMFVRYVRFNLPERSDAAWLASAGAVLSGDEEKVPEVGRYNAGQKLLFWALVLCMLVLLASGVVIWRQYFSHAFAIGQIRFAALAHATAAFVLITAIIVHIYAAIWIKGSLGAMLYGKVSRAWARKHHPGWAKEVERK